MSNEIQIDYTSRDFDALKTDLVNLINARTNIDWDASDPSDLGAVLVEAFAYMGDIMSYYLDRVANETTVDTAVKRETLLNFAKLYGYKPSGPTPATITILFKLIMIIYSTSFNSTLLPKSKCLYVVNYTIYRDILSICL